jgi:hypothetical protein
MAGISHYCERDHQRTGTGDDCRQEYWKRRHKLNWTGRSNTLYTIINLNIMKQTQLKMEQTELNRNTELPTLYNNKNQHQELNRI